MSSELWVKLLVLVVVVALGWGAGRTRLLGGGETVRALSNLAFYLFTPALLFRSTVRMDFHAMPWGTLLAFFGPAVLWLLIVYALNRKHLPRDPALPAARAIGTSFGNTVQLGLPLVAALYGEGGLAIHVAIISLHALTLMTLATLLVELDIAHAAHRHGEGRQLLVTLGQTAKAALAHPVITPVVCGLLWNLLGWPVWPLMDATLQMLAAPVVPMCLVLIGLSLAHYGVKGAVSVALWMSAGKMLCMPLLVLLAGHVLLGQNGMPLAVIVLAAALPVGSNALLFAQRYRTQEAQATAAIVVSTLGFMLVVPLWLAVLAWLSA
jgi:malonate transporter